MKDNTYLNKSRNYLSDGRLQDCINLIKENVNDEDILNQVLQLEIRFNTLNRRIINGTIDVTDAQLEENRISNPLLMIISNLARGKKDFIPNIQTKKQIDFKLIIIGILGLFLLGLGLYLFTNSNNSESSLCETINCENNGECVNGKCKCPEGFSGKYCQIKNNVPDPGPHPQSTLKPDLKITEFHMNPEIPTEGEIVYMEAIVKNLGSKDSKRFKINWWASIDALRLSPNVGQLYG